MRIEWKLLKNEPGLETLERDWRALFARLGARQANFVHLWDWHRAYCAALRPRDEDVWYCAGYRDGALVAIVPLVLDSVRVSRVPLRGARLPQHDHLPYGDILVAPGNAARIDLHKVLRALRGRTGVRCDVFRSGPVLAESCLAEVMTSHRMSTRDTNGCSDSLPATDYDALLAGLSKNARGALRKARNKLAALDGVDIATVTDAAELPDAFDAFIAVESSGWKAAARSAIRFDPALVEFYRRLCDSGRCDINVLRQGPDVLAAQFCLRAGERLFVLKIGYDEGQKRLAPGNLLLERILQRCETHPDIRYVDLVSNADWHERWHPIQRPVFDYYLFDRTSVGLVGAAAWRLKRTIRAAQRPAQTL